MPVNKKFTNFLKKLPHLQREFYLLMRMYEQSCEDLGDASNFVETQILESYSQVSEIAKKETKPSVLNAIEKLDKEFDEKLGKWAESESECDCSDCQNESECSGVE